MAWLEVVMVSSSGFRGFDGLSLLSDQENAAPPLVHHPLVWLVFPV